MYPKFRSKDDPNHSGADDGLHVWERPSPFDDISDEEMIEMWNAFVSEAKRKQEKEQEKPRRERRSRSFDQTKNPTIARLFWKQLRRSLFDRLRSFFGRF